MTEFIVAGLMWALVAALSFRVRTRPDNTMFVAATVIAASLTTNVDAIYLWAASWMPWPNVLDLVANGLLIFGVSYLSRAIIKGATRRSRQNGRGARWPRYASTAVLVVMACAFAFIDDPRLSTTFMLSFGDQLAAGIYSAVQYIYIFAVMSVTLFTCVKNVPRMRQGRFRLGFSITGVGCAVAMLLCIVVVGMDIAHVLGSDSVLRSLGTIYNYLYLATMVLLCVGLGIPPIGRLLNSLAVRGKVVAIEPQIRRIWLSTVADSPAVSLVEPMEPPIAGAKAVPKNITTAGMHRMVIEILDWANVHRSSRGLVSDADWEAVRQAESLCLKHGKVLL
ncbi:UNVERIFIED_ORG: hypothetical protein ABIB52_000814 [Arthrobacter sp. UYCu721]